VIEKRLTLCVAVGVGVIAVGIAGAIYLF